MDSLLVPCSPLQKSVFSSQKRISLRFLGLRATRAETSAQSTVRLRLVDLKRLLAARWAWPLGPYSGATARPAHSNPVSAYSASTSSRERNLIIFDWLIQQNTLKNPYQITDKSDYFLSLFKTLFLLHLAGLPLSSPESLSCRGMS